MKQKHQFRRVAKILKGLLVVSLLFNFQFSAFNTARAQMKGGTPVKVTHKTQMVNGKRYFARGFCFCFLNRMFNLFKVILTQRQFANKGTVLHRLKLNYGCCSGSRFCFKVSLFLKAEDFCSNKSRELLNSCIVSAYNFVIAIAFCCNTIFCSFKLTL